jgi:predicted O-methyltransferase YrrM
VALREFNSRVMADDRVDVVMLSVGDGVSVARRR